MAQIEALPVTIISRIVDECTDETTSDIKLMTRAQVALAQTNHRLHDIVLPVIQATNICQAAEDGRLDIIKKAHQDGADLNMTGTTNHGKRGTPLHHAIINGHGDILKFLVEVGVDPHVPSTGLCECWPTVDGIKPYALHMAMAHSKIKGAAKLLVEKLGAYWSLSNMPALMDQLPEDEEEREQIFDLLINLPGPEPASFALRYALHHRMNDLEERILARQDLDASFCDALGRTPLFNAILYGRSETVKSLLKRPEADVSIAQENGFTPLHAAVDRRNLPYVKALLQRPEVDATKEDDHKMTPLHYAAMRGELDIVKLLLQQPGVDVASPGREGMTPLHLAVRSRNHMLHPLKNPQGEKGKPFTEPVGYRGESIKIIKILLNRLEMNAGLHDKQGFTPLHRACLLGDLRVAELLLQRKDVDPNARGLNGQTPLHIASTCPRRSALLLMGRLLEEPGVEIDDTDYDGRTILHYICGSAPQVWYSNIVIDTAVREGVPIDKLSTNGLTALHQAICSGNYSIAKYLLAKGADPMVSKRFKYNNSLLHLCLKGSYRRKTAKSDIVEALLKRGIEIDTYTNSPLYDSRNDEKDYIENVEGILSMDVLTGTDCTPLMLTAIGQRSIESMKMLLKAGADPNAQVIIRDLQLEGKTKSNRQAFLSGVFRHTWNPEKPSDKDILEIEEPLKLLLKHGSRIDFDGPADSPLQEACKAAEDDRVTLLSILLDFSTAKNVSQKHVGEVISDYESKPEHVDIVFMLNQAEPCPPSPGMTTAACDKSDRDRIRYDRIEPLPRWHRRQLMHGANCRTQSIYKSHDVVQVNIPAESGEMGVLANHVPSIEQLKPGLVEVVEESAGSKQFFLSGGFATVQPNSVLSINAVEGYPLEDFSAEAIRAQIAEAQKVANGSGSEQDIAEAKIELEVLETLSAHGQRVDDGTKTHDPRDSDSRQKLSNPSRKEHQQTSVVKGSKGQDSSSRPSVTGFQPRASNGRKVSSRPSQLPRYSASTGLLPPESMLTSYLASSNPSRTASTTEKCQDAIDILEQYGIPRPAGWFSDGGASTPGRIIQNRPTLSQICHSCGKPLAFERYCSHCGHDFCIKCTGETPGDIPKHKVPKSSDSYRQHDHKNKIGESPNQEECPPNEDNQPARITLDIARRRKMSRFASEPKTPKTPSSTERKPRVRPKTDQEFLKPVRKKTIAAPTEISSSVKNNPFFMADRGTMKKPSEPATIARSVQVERKPKHSDCVPDRLLSKSPRASHVQKECSDPSCRATHTGHHPTRHSIGCATRRSLGALVVEGNELDMIDGDKGKHEMKHVLSGTKSPQSKLQMKIDQLYHHGQDLHHSQHIMEHLAAGVNTLPSSATEEKPPHRPDGRSGIDDYKLRVSSQPVLDHGLSQDETVTVGTKTAEHSLSRDAAVTGEIESKPLNLNEHKGDRHPSPKSCEPHVNNQDFDAHWIDPSLGSHGQACDVQEGHSRSLTSQPTGAKPTLAPQTPNKGLGTSQEEYGRVAPQAQNTPLPDKPHSVNHGSDKRTDKPDEPVPGVHMLRKTIPRDDAERPNAETTNISSWRTQLRKVDKSLEQPSSQRLTPSHVENWRHELSSVNHRTPVSEKEKKEDCINCNPSQYISPQAETSLQSFAEIELQKKNEYEQSTAVEPPIPRLKVTDVELSLARQGDEELMAKRQELHDKETEEQSSPQPLDKKDVPVRKDSVMSTVIHDPTPMMPYNHMCAWRAQYMDLKSQVDQLGDDSNYPLPGRRAEGVGTLCSHTHTDIDIEGLTVVMHFRGKDDLVINTDLREDIQEHRRQQRTGDL
ncbi:hypothetical protein FLONG3_774 [Fusarium longipes]|uniref:ATP synthase subunit delta, mitochondrial n=1 Tax=Fusarium longipes TaxID=694270 RepID=A0A395T9I4_9HYPO|nr:hypothetical protein FLONG3_774 [Fusarium longipes]